MRTNGPRVAQGIALLAILLTSACQTPGADDQANVYGENQVNTQQAAKVVNILAVLPARVEVDNSQNQQTAQLVGGILGAVGGGLLGGAASENDPTGAAIGATSGGTIGVVAGSLVPSAVLVEGVSITYEDQGQTMNSAQVGKLCEYAPGRAIVVITGPGVTRIQPNATCPLPKT
jgi:outer membrane lipoprotein SlyB